MDSDYTAFIDNANPYFYCSCVILIFFTLLSLSWPVLVLWSIGCGVLSAYIFFRNRSLIPNLLIHLKQADVNEEGQVGVVSCPVCGKDQCSRHPKVVIESQDVSMPWAGLHVPKTVDDTLTKFLNIIMERFINEWHSDVTKSTQFNSEVRHVIRHAICLFVHRVAKIDIPSIVTGPLLQVLAQHMQLYITIHKRLPHNASYKLFKAVAMETLGTHLHVALRGETGEFRYFKNLTRSVLPLLVTSNYNKSKLLHVFMEELFACKVMIPAMDQVSSSDFLNRILILIFDKESKLCRVPFPPSCPVPLLQSFATQEPKETLQPSLMKILKDQKLLYSFMQYLKKRHSFHLLQFYLTCSDVIEAVEATKMGPLLAQNSSVYIDQIKQLYELYTLHTADTSIVLDYTLINTIHQVINRDGSDLSKITYIIQNDLLTAVQCHIKGQLELVYCSSYYHSLEYHDSMYPLLTVQTQRSLLSTDQLYISRHFDKWRSRRKRRMTSRNLSTETDIQSNTPPITRQRSSSIPSSPSPVFEDLEESVSFSRCLIQVIDTESVGGAIKKPHTLYTILSRQERDGKTVVFKVKRRYKEFVVLDSRLRQFYRDVSLCLPPKRAFHNMDKTFIESRMKELENYLQKLVEEPEIRNSQLLQSFLTDTADISLFMPDTVGDKAGKIIKSVPRALKKEPKGQYLDALLISMDESVVIAPREPCPEKRVQTDKQVTDNEVIIEHYNKELSNDLSNDKRKPWSTAPTNTGNDVSLNGIMDLLVYLAIDVYEVSKTKLSVLLAAKMLAQSSVNTFLYSLLADRIELVCQEHEICQLIELLQYHLFIDDSPPRSEEEKEERRQLALQTILTRPPQILIDAIGRETFTNNTALLVEGLQNQFLAKHMLFSMLDIVVCELFPELKV